MDPIYFAGANYRIKGEYIPGQGYPKAFSPVHSGNGTPYAYSDGLTARRSFFSGMKHHSALYRTVDLKTAQRVVIGSLDQMKAEDMPEEITLSKALADKVQKAAQQEQMNARQKR